MGFERLSTNLAQLAGLADSTRADTLRSSATYQRVCENARMCDERPEASGVLSTGEQCAAALLCNDAGMLPTGMTFIDAVDRLAGEWLACVVQANRDGWRTG